MRGGDRRTGELFSCQRGAGGAGARILCALCADRAAVDLAPEKLLRAMLLQAFYSIRSERQLMERLEYDLLFRWFVGVGGDASVWDHSVFSKNRDRCSKGILPQDS
jgi:transposase